MEKAKNYVIIGLAALMMIFYVRSCQLHKRLMTAPKPSVVYVDKKGNEHVVQKVEETKIKREFNTDSIKALTGIKKHNIKGVTKIAITGSDSIHAAVVDKEFTYADEKISIKGHLYGDSVKINYVWKDTVGIVQYEKKGELMNDVSTTNSHIVDLKTAQTPRKRNKRFGIGPYAGVDITGRPSIGVSVQFNIFRF